MLVKLTTSVSVGVAKTLICKSLTIPILQIFREVWKVQNFTFDFRSTNLEGSHVGKDILKTWSQFHQHFTYEFYVRTSFRQLFSIYVLALGRNLYKKFVHKTLMKLTPEVNFTNMFKSSFYMHRSQKRKKTVKSQVSFCACILTVFLHFWDLHTQNISEIDPCFDKHICLKKLLVKCWWNWNVTDENKTNMDIHFNTIIGYLIN